MNTIRQRLEAIRNDRVQGASQLTCQALETLQLAAESLPAMNTLEFSHAITGIANEMAELRPNMVSIKYYMTRYVEEINHSTNPDDFRALAGQVAGKLLEEWEQARHHLVMAGADLVKSNHTILTCSYSSSVIRSLVQANKSGRNYTLLIASSQQGTNSPAYGENMARELIQQGIDSELIPDLKIGDYMDRVDMALFGADALLADGTLVNGYPSRAIAQLASEAVPPVPVYTLCETSKFTMQHSAILEAGFDLIPLNLLTAIVSEHGVLGCPPRAG